MGTNGLGMGTQCIVSWDLLTIRKHKISPASSNWPPFFRSSVNVRCTEMTQRHKIRRDNMRGRVMTVEKEKEKGHGVWHWLFQMVHFKFWQNLLLVRVTEVSWGGTQEEERDPQRGFYMHISLSGMLFKNRSLKHIIYINYWSGEIWCCLSSINCCI